MINKKKPVYLAIPMDICELEIDDIPNMQKEKSDRINLKTAMEHIMLLLTKAKKPVVIADMLVERFEAQDELFRLLEKTKYPVTTLLMGKGLIDWNYSECLGTYLGESDNKTTYEYVNNSDCIISIGAIYSDLNTLGFDYKFKPQEMIDIEGTYTIVENVRYDNVLMKDILFELSKIAPLNKIECNKREFTFTTPEVQADDKLTAEFIYPKLQEFIKENDIIFSETGLVEFGFAPMKLPLGAKLYNQVLWGSIGWATPATFGAAIAAKDKRVILVTGEGSHQLTAQEVSSMMRYGTKPIIIVLNNSGYTVERILSKNPMDSFNNIAKWNYTKLPLVFDGDVWIAEARTNKEFNNALQRAEFEQEDRLCYIEIFTDIMDTPKLAKSMVENKLIKKKATI